MLSKERFGWLETSCGERLQIGLNRVSRDRSGGTVSRTPAPLAWPRTSRLASASAPAPASVIVNVGVRVGAGVGAYPAEPCWRRRRVLRDFDSEPNFEIL